MPVKTEISQRLRADIIKFLYYKKGLSLTDLSKLTKRSVPLVTLVINDLIEDGTVIEKGFAPSTGGRRPAIFLLNPHQHKYIVAVAMDQLITTLAIYNMAHEVVFPVQRLQLNISNASTAVNQLILFIEHSIASSGIRSEHLLGLGLGMPGFVNAESGVNETYLPTPNGLSLQSYLSEELNIPVLVENDSTLIALAELHFGKAVNLKNAMVVNISWGTGLGIIINGKLYKGSAGFAGEFSHISVSDSEILCSCGNKGCLQVDSSLTVMVEKAEAAMQKGATSILTSLFLDQSKHKGDHFLDAAINGDELAIKILTTACSKIGKGIATLIHLFNPSGVILSGRGARVGELLLPPIKQAIDKHCIPRIAKNTKLIISSLAENAELLAAASLVIEHQKLE